MASEKEVNVYLFEQLRIVEQAIKLAKTEGAPKTLAYLEEEKRYIELKLYQKPPMAD